MQFLSGAFGVAIGLWIIVASGLGAYAAKGLLDTLNSLWSVIA